MQDLLVSLAKILVILASVAKISKNFEKSCKILRTLPRLIVKILAGNLKNPRFFFARNPKFILVLLPRSWIFLVFLPRSWRVFLNFSPRSWKILQNLANLAKNNFQDLGKKCQKSKKFLGKKTKTPSPGHPILEARLLCDFLRYQILISNVTQAEKYKPQKIWHQKIGKCLLRKTQERWISIKNSVVKVNSFENNTLRKIAKLFSKQNTKTYIWIVCGTSHSLPQGSLPWGCLLLSCSDRDWKDILFPRCCLYAFAF